MKQLFSVGKYSTDDKNTKNVLNLSKSNGLALSLAKDQF